MFFRTNLQKNVFFFVVVVEQQRDSALTETSNDVIITFKKGSMEADPTFTKEFLLGDSFNTAPL